MVISLVAFAAGAPFVRVPLAHVPPFIPAYEAALWVTNTITAVLLFSQFVRLRSRALLVLAGGYLFDALMVVPHALSFPGVFSETGLMGSGPQSTAWLYMFWHGGFPLFALAYTLLARRPADSLAGNPKRAILTCVFGVAGLVAALTLLATAGQAMLPVVIHGGDYSALVSKGYSPTMWLATAAILFILWRRSLPTVLELWLMVVLVAWLLDVAFAAVIGSSRYDLGFYAGRVYGLMAASFVLAMLLLETNRLYDNLAQAFALAERRNAELARSREEFAQVQRFEAIGQLVGGVAHDFNNILTVIAGGTELLLRNPALPARDRRLLEASLGAAKRGERITQQLLTFARKQVLRPEVVNLNELIAGLESFIRGAVSESVRLAPALSLVLWPVRIDRTEFETALVNLVVNARDAIGGKGEIGIETRNETLAEGEVSDLQAGKYVVVSVSDSGPGMAPEVAERAFDPFFTTKEPGKGSGLGLSQVYGFARGASGQARIFSRSGEGTRVEILLPKSAGQVAPKPFELGPLRAAHGSETVLVVEDDPEVLEVAVSGLVDLGYWVKSATDAQQALRILRNDPSIDILFADVVMPGGMNGAQLAIEARRIRPELKVLLTSGYPASALTEEHGLTDTLDVLPKPYKRDELATRLRLVMRV